MRRAHTEALPIDVILDRLSGTVRSGRGWRAECPACGGRSKKLSVAEAPNGSVLLHCFGCGDLFAILGSIGLKPAHLYPPSMTESTREWRLANRRMLREAGWNSALRVLAYEANVIAIAGAGVASGSALSKSDLERLEVAVHRVEDAKLVLSER